MLPNSLSALLEWASVSPGPGVACTRAYELPRCTWNVGMHAWPGGGILSSGTSLLPLPSSLFSVAHPHTSCPEPGSAELGAWGENAGCGSDIHQVGGSSGRRSLRGIWGSRHWLLREEDRQRRQVRLRAWSQAASITLSSLAEACGILCPPS